MTRRTFHAFIDYALLVLLFLSVSVTAVLLMGMLAQWMRGL